jgi:alanine racemase
MVFSEGRLTIDLGAIRRNWQSLQDRVGPACICAAVVKANAYGLGADRVVPALYAQGCRHFYVATVSEGASLRHYLAGDARIYILGGLRPGAERYCLEHDLIPVLFTEPQLQRWYEATIQQGVAAPCAIKFDTGMSRLGFSVAELQRLCAESALLPALNVQWLVSHLACADESQHKQNTQQLDVYRQVLAQVRDLLPGVKASLANSSGIFLGEPWYFDMVRPGASLYGVNPTPSEVTPVESVVSLQLPIVQVRQADEGVCVGYGAEYQVNQSMRLAVVLGGYADGIHRAVGGSTAAGKGWLCGVEVPVVGRISMDTTVFDISAVPSERLPPEGEAFIELLGAHQGVDKVGADAGTIGYEILTSLGGRYERAYIG